MKPPLAGGISVIVPTIGRPDSLERMLQSLCEQTLKIQEVIVADGSANEETLELVSRSFWKKKGLRIVHLRVQPPNAVRQRQSAIAASKEAFLLLLDDDVVLESGCVEQMTQLFQDQKVVAVFADFNNQSWPMPTRLWRYYLRYFLRMEEGEWRGRVVGPLLRFGFNPSPEHPVPIEWLGTGNTMIRRSAYDKSGGFSEFFLHRCTFNEDVDLGIKLSRLGKILFCPLARLSHFHAPGGRVSLMIAAEDDLYNRYMVMRRTQGRSVSAAFAQILIYFSIETVSNLGWCFRHMQGHRFAYCLGGHLRALCRILADPLLVIAR